MREGGARERDGRFSTDPPSFPHHFFRHDRKKDNELPKDKRENRLCVPNWNTQFLYCGYYNAQSKLKCRLYRAHPDPTCGGTCKGCKGDDDRTCGGTCDHGKTGMYCTPSRHTSPKAHRGKTAAGGESAGEQRHPPPYPRLPPPSP